MVEFVFFINKTMKNILTAFAWIIIVIAGVLLGISSLYLYPNAPLGLHEWVPVPVACAGYYCVTYGEWSRAIKKNGSDSKPEVILSALVLDKATQLVAYYEKVRISDGEVTQASSAVEKTINAIPGGKNMINEAYGGNFSSFLTKKGVSAILLREKLSTIGVTSPWNSKYAPMVTVWNIGLKWDVTSKNIVTK